ncbi:MAG: ADP-heptose--LPS heptosyltransferase [Phycisphaeraceae bacterium]|nr:MAG: ADP-heptose--LPS heptosyltransferase [Phycisphaeraceae bacterium]
MPRADTTQPTRILVVLPSWVGDAVMATPALRLLRDRLPGAFIGALCRPGLDALLAGTNLIDEFHTQQPAGVMTPKHAAAKVRGRKYDAALLLTNSFSTALTARLAFIPRRVGYDRDGRGVLLTERLRPPKNPDGSWTITPAVNYYEHAAQAFLGDDPPPLSTAPLTRADRAPLILPDNAKLELACTEGDRARANATLASATVAPDQPFAILNPGGNNPAKRWPPERFSALADHLWQTHHLSALINGAPAEADLCRSIAAGASCDPAPVVLSDHDHSLAGLKALCERARLMVTNDTGPRHIAAAFGVPLVSLFGPTDARWTTIPCAREAVVLADPTLDPSESANDHPDRCAIEHITPERVQAAVEDVLN